MSFQLIRTKNQRLGYALNSDTFQFMKEEFEEGSKGIEKPLESLGQGIFCGHLLIIYSRRFSQLMS
jgi:hypothetical protein